MAQSDPPASQTPGETSQAESPASETPASRRVLVVEDEEALALGVRDALQHAGYEAQTVFDGLAARDVLRREEFDLVVLDLMLPGANGFDVLEELRRENQRIRVLILTALADEKDVLRGFELGADDYMAKPFSPRELVARVDAQFRRESARTAQSAQLDLPQGIRVDLARREGEILAYLVKNRDRVVTREDLLLDVWHYRNPNVATRTVDIHIVGLRRKVEPDAGNPTLIQTVRGKGYRWFN